jgi:hypothetical protein
MSLSSPAEMGTADENRPRSLTQNQAAQPASPTIVPSASPPPDYNTTQFQLQPSGPIYQTIPQPIFQQVPAVQQVPQHVIQHFPSVHQTPQPILQHVPTVQQTPQHIIQQVPAVYQPIVPGQVSYMSPQVTGQQQPYVITPQAATFAPMYEKGAVASQPVSQSTTIVTGKGGDGDGTLGAAAGGVVGGVAGGAAGGALGGAAGGAAGGCLGGCCGSLAGSCAACTALLLCCTIL